MYSEIQQDILKFIDDYLKETPKEVLQKEAEAIRQLNFAGATAKDYFEYFDKFYHGEVVEVSKKMISTKIIPLTVATKNYKLVLKGYQSRHLLPYNTLPHQPYKLSSK